MAIYTRLLKGAAVPEQDGSLVAALNAALQDSTADGEPYIAGFRNGSGEVYRTVVVAGSGEMMKAIRTVNSLGYRLDLDCAERRIGVDAIFSKQH